GATTSKTCTGGDVLHEPDAYGCFQPGTSLKRSNRADNQIRFVRRILGRRELKARSRLNIDLVKPVDRLKDRPNFVVAVLALAENAQVEINFRERSQQHRDDCRNVV